MRHWFQNLAKEDSKLVHFRGTLWGKKKRLLSYSVWSGLNLRLSYIHGEADDSSGSSSLTIGLLFITVCLTFDLPKNWYFKRKCIATWDNNREFWLTDGRRYGFYFHDGAFVAYWNKPTASGDCQVYFQIDDFFLGRTEVHRQNVCEVKDVQFRIGQKEFKLDQVSWERCLRFRRNVPFSLWHKEYCRVEMEIENPPMRAGKGENSWDLEDDGTYGLSTTWPYPTPKGRLGELEELKKLAVKVYVENTLKSAHKYGAGGGERGVSASDAWEYIPNAGGDAQVQSTV